MRKIDENGYLRIDGELEHRRVWINEYGNPPKGWVVHHCDENKLNNELSNLVALPPAYHEMIHRDAFRKKMPLPSREYLLRVYHEYRKQIDELLPRWREVYSEYKSLEQKLRALGVMPEKAAKRVAKKKKEPWTGPRQNKKKLRMGPEEVRKADLARVAQIKRMRARAK